MAGNHRHGSLEEAVRGRGVLKMLVVENGRVGELSKVGRTLKTWNRRNGTCASNRLPPDRNSAFFRWKYVFIPIITDQTHTSSGPPADLRIGLKGIRGKTQDCILAHKLESKPWKQNCQIVKETNESMRIRNNANVMNHHHRNHRDALQHLRNYQVSRNYESKNMKTTSSPHTYVDHYTTSAVVGGTRVYFQKNQSLPYFSSK